MRHPGGENYGKRKKWLFWIRVRCQPHFGDYTHYEFDLRIYYASFRRQNRSRNTSFAARLEYHLDCRLVSDDIYKTHFETSQHLKNSNSLRRAVCFLYNGEKSSKMSIFVENGEKMRRDKRKFTLFQNLSPKNAPIRLIFPPYSSYNSHVKGEIAWTEWI